MGLDGIVGIGYCGALAFRLTGNFQKEKRP